MIIDCETARRGRDVVNVLPPARLGDSWTVYVNGGWLSSGLTRDDAVREAVAVLEWAADTLQGQEPIGDGK